MRQLQLTAGSGQPRLPLILTIHLVGCPALLWLDEQRAGEWFADSLVGTNSVISQVGTRLLGRHFSDWNVVADLPTFWATALLMSQFGLLAVWSTLCSMKATKKWGVALGCVLWSSSMYLVVPMAYGTADAIGVIALQLSIAFVIVFAVVRFFLGEVTNGRKRRNPRLFEDRCSLRQALGILSCLAIGLAMKRVDTVAAETVLLAIITGLAACLAAWSVTPFRKYRIAIVGVAAISLGFLPYLALGEKVGRDPCGWFVFSLSTATAIMVTALMLGKSGRESLGLA